jgi:hypothetical protein
MFMMLILLMLMLMLPLDDETKCRRKQKHSGVSMYKQQPGIKDIPIPSHPNPTLHSPHSFLPIGKNQSTH